MNITSLLHHDSTDRVSRGLVYTVEFEVAQLWQSEFEFLREFLRGLCRDTADDRADS